MSEAGVRQEIVDKLTVLENIIAGLSKDSWGDDDNFNPEEVMYGPFLDENTDSLNESVYVQDWMVRQLGNHLESFPTRAEFISPDGLVRVVIIDAPLGVTEDWLISVWSEQGKKPWYYFASEEMYGMMLLEYTPV